MKLEDFRELKPNEVAVVLDNGVEHVAIARYNQEGGDCGCCKNYSLDQADVVVVRDALTGKQVWPEFYVNGIAAETFKSGKHTGFGWAKIGRRKGEN